jgi:hypothetical protein
MHLAGDVMKICRLFFLLVMAAHFFLFAAQEPTAAVKRSIPPPGDSASQAQKKTSSVNVSASTPTASQNKMESVDKKTVIEEEDLLIEEGDVKKNAARDAAIKDSLARLQSALPVHVDSAQAQKSNVAAGADTQKNALPNQKVENVTAPKDSVNAAVTAQAEKKPVPQPARVESVHSINFAKNLKDYRSPKVAMFLSLIVPGLGQAYTKHYVRTGIFVALEATAIGLSVFYNGKGKKQYNDGKAFADRNFSFDKFTTYYQDLFNFIKSAQNGGSDSVAQDKLNAIYFDSLHAFTAAYNSKSPTPEFYRDLEGTSNPFVQGWNDCEPSFPQIKDFTGNYIQGKNFKYQPYTDADSLLYLVTRFDNSGNKLDSGIFGYSPDQVTYSNMMSKSNDYYKTANTILAIMIINHIASAVDALIGAMAYNNELLGRESLWQHIKIAPQCVVDPVNPSFGVAFRMGF